MKRIIAGWATIVLACLWASPVAAYPPAAGPAPLAAAPPVEVPFTVAKKDIESWWKKAWSTETILEISPAGEGISSVKIVNLRKVPYYSAPARVKVKRANGTVATFSVSAIYKKPAEKWIFENVATGNVQEEKAAGQDPPPFAEAEAMITKGWVDKFSPQGDTDIKILKVHPNPKFKAYGKRFWFIYLVDLEYTSAASRDLRKHCKGQEVDLVKENADAPWVFGAFQNTNVCEARPIK